MYVLARGHRIWEALETQRRYGYPGARRRVLPRDHLRKALQTQRGYRYPRARRRILPCGRLLQRRAASPRRLQQRWQRPAGGALRRRRRRERGVLSGRRPRRGGAGLYREKLRRRRWRNSPSRPRRGAELQDAFPQDFALRALLDLPTGCSSAVRESGRGRPSARLS